MTDPRLDEARALKKKATALRNRGQLPRALETLDEAIRILEPLPADADVSAAVVKEVRAELADTLGMKGGTFRRAGDLDAALAAYTAGREIEVADQQSTYNLANVIALRITHEGRSPEDPAIRADLARAIAHLEAETSGPRSDEWWAWSDLAQFYLLTGEPGKARASYATATTKTGATAEEIKRHAAVLEELERKTAASAPEIAKTIRAAIDELTP